MFPVVKENSELVMPETSERVSLVFGMNNSYRFQSSP